MRSDGPGFLLGLTGLVSFIDILSLSELHPPSPTSIHCIHILYIFHLPNSILHPPPSAEGAPGYWTAFGAVVPASLVWKTSSGEAGRSREGEDQGAPVGFGGTKRRWVVFFLVFLLAHMAGMNGMLGPSCFEQKRQVRGRYAWVCES